MLNNKLIIIIIAIVLVISIGVTVAIIIANNENTKDVSDVVYSTIISDTPITPNNSIKIPVFIGNTELSEERAELLEKGILTEIERLSTGTPKEDENGNFLTDEYGILMYESNCDVDYTEMQKNLAVIINYFADKNYSNEAIFQIQRYYFHYARSFAKYETKNVIEKMELCFPAGGTNPDDLTKKAEEIFGQIREDGFPFVFEAPVEIANIQVMFCAVKAWGNTVLKDDEETICIFDEIYSGNKIEQNLEGWLHKIINEMSLFGYGEKELIIAQLLYAGSLSETEYRYDLIDAMRMCISCEQEQSIEDLKVAVQTVFDVNVEYNIALMDYLEGLTVYGDV